MSFQLLPRSKNSSK